MCKRHQALAHGCAAGVVLQLLVLSIGGCGGEGPTSGSALPRSRSHSLRASQQSTSAQKKTQLASAGGLAASPQQAQGATEYVCCHTTACKALTPPGQCDFDSYACTDKTCGLVGGKPPTGPGDVVAKSYPVDPIAVQADSKLTYGSGGANKAPPSGPFPGGGGPVPPGEPTFEDPSCALLPDHIPCDNTPPHGGNGSGSSGGHYGEWDCTACNLDFIGCFAGCNAPGLICRGLCVYKYVKCARATCDDA